MELLCLKETTNKQLVQIFKKLKFISTIQYKKLESLELDKCY